jgi:hypothetical protein
MFLSINSTIKYLIRNFAFALVGMLSMYAAHAVTVTIVPSAPGVKQSLGNGLPGYTTENFAGFSAGALTTGTSSVGPYTTTGSVIEIAAGSGSITDGNFVWVGANSSITFTLAQESRYVGLYAMWLSSGNSFKFYDSSDNLIATLDSSSIVNLLNTPGGVVADNGQTYPGSQYMAAGQTEYSAYINLRLNDPAISFKKIVLTNDVNCCGNEFDNITVSAAYELPGSTPAAIPTLGEWAMIFMASLMAMFGIRRMRRSK